MVPLFGVLALDWTVFSILLLYWCENVVVGVFNVLRLIFVQPRNPVVWVGKGFLIPFFMVHYGGFTFVHGMFVLSMFGGKGVQTNLNGVLGAIRAEDLGYAIAALALSHGVSFVHNFLMDGEYQRTTTSELMARPYARVMVLHITILAGGFLVLALHSAVPALMVLVGIKTTIDLGAHVTERKKLSKGAGGRAQEAGRSVP